MGTFIAEHLIAAIISAFSAVLATYLTVLAGKALKAFEEKTKIDVDNKTEERIQNIIRKVVMSISQTFVSGLKEKGEFNDEKKREALEKAIEESGKIIFEELGLVKTSDQLRTSVEAEIGEQKEVERVVKAASNESKGRIKKKR